MKYKALAAVYHFPEERRTKTSMILVVNSKGELHDYIPGPLTVDEYEGRYSDKKAKVALQECIKDHLKIGVATEDIKLMPYEELGKVFFKLQNK
jgi:hypothetical protein